MDGIGSQADQMAALQGLAYICAEPGRKSFAFSQYRQTRLLNVHRTLQFYIERLTDSFQAGASVDSGILLIRFCDIPSQIGKQQTPRGGIVPQPDAQGEMLTALGDPNPDDLLCVRVLLDCFGDQ